jgi:hypothetical protein
MRYTVRVARSEISLPCILGRPLRTDTLLVTLRLLPQPGYVPMGNLPGPPLDSEDFVDAGVASSMSWAKTRLTPVASGDNVISVPALYS